MSDGQLEYPNYRHLVEFERYIASRPGTVGALNHQRIGLDRNAVALVALVIAVERLPRRLAIEHDMDLLLAALEAARS